MFEGGTVMGFKVASRRGLSDEAAFGTEEQCRTALVRLRWPDGFVCPCCGHREHCVLEGRGLYQCNPRSRIADRGSESVSEGLRASPNSMETHLLDHAYLGGARSGGKRGRGAARCHPTRLA